MLDRFLSLLSSLDKGRTAPAHGVDDPRVAAAALLVHVMDSDGERHDAEHEMLEASLAGRYGLSRDAVARLIDAGEAADREAVDLYAFTRVLSRDLDLDGKRDFVRLLWDVAHADGSRTEIEEHVVWRVAELIGIDANDRIALRQLSARNGENGA